MTTVLDVKGEAKIVKESEANGLLSRGWRLVAVVPKQRMFFVDESGQRYEPDEHGNGFRTAGTTMWARPSGALKAEHALDAAYIVERDQESALAVACEERDRLREYADQVNRQLQLAETDKGAFEKKLKEALEGKKQAEATLEMVRNQSEGTARVLRDNLSKMESDLGRVREHFGKKAFEEALGGK